MKIPKIEAPRLRDSHENAPEIFESRGDYLGLRIESANFSGQIASRLEIVGCRFANTKLSQTHWENAHLSDCIFQNCDFAGAKWLEADFHRVEFLGCRFTGFCAPSSRFSHVVFRDCQLNLAQLREANTKSFQLENCVLIESDWSGGDLRGAVFHRCDLGEADFFNAKLQNADLRGSEIQTLRLSDDPAKNVLQLRGVKLEPMQVALLGAQLGLKVIWPQDDD